MGAVGGGGGLLVLFIGFRMSWFHVGILLVGCVVFVCDDIVFLV